MVEELIALAIQDDRFLSRRFFFCHFFSGNLIELAVIFPHTTFQLHLIRFRESAKINVF
jgi:hypothetical protein